MNTILNNGRSVHWIEKTVVPPKRCAYSNSERQIVVVEMALSNWMVGIKSLKTDRNVNLTS
jgi:hypothetical protein